MGYQGRVRRKLGLLAFGLLAFETETPLLGGGDEDGEDENLCLAGVAVTLVGMVGERAEGLAACLGNGEEDGALVFFG